MAQIGILALSACLLIITYTSYRGYKEPENLSLEQIKLGYRVSRLELGLTTVFALGFMLMVLDSEWWWLDIGFYGAVIAGLVDLWVYRQLR